MHVALPIASSGYQRDPSARSSGAGVVGGRRGPTKTKWCSFRRGVWEMPGVEVFSLCFNVFIKKAAAFLSFFIPIKIYKANRRLFSGKDMS